MSNESQDDITAQDYQQEVAAFWEDIPGAIIDKIGDGGLVYCDEVHGRLELTPDDVQDVWLALKPIRFVGLLYAMIERLLEQYPTLTLEQRIERLMNIERYAHMAHRSLEYGIPE